MLSLSDFEELAIKVKNRKDRADCEENTKLYLIMPFLKVLGYDAEEPDDIKYEFTCDFGKKQGRKVDYAIFNNGELTFILEAKDARLTNWRTNQDYIQALDDYFRYSDTHLAVLTNGLEYRFFTDSDKDGFVDLEPFRVVDILNVTESDVEFFQLLQKGHADIDKLRLMLSQETFKFDLKKWLEVQCVEPSSSFMGYLQSEIKSCPKDTSILQDIICSVFNSFVDEPVINCSNADSNSDIEVSGFKVPLSKLTNGIRKKGKIFAFAYKDKVLEIIRWNRLIEVLAKSVGVDIFIQMGYLSTEFEDNWRSPKSFNINGNMYCYDAHGSAWEICRKLCVCLKNNGYSMDDMYIGLVSPKDLYKLKSGVSVETLYNEIEELEV